MANLFRNGAANNDDTCLFNFCYLSVRQSLLQFVVVNPWDCLWYQTLSANEASLITLLAFEPKDSICSAFSLRAVKTSVHDCLMESFQIAFLTSEKRGWTLPRLSSKGAEMFTPKLFWAGDSPAAEAGETLVEIR